MRRSAVASLEIITAFCVAHMAAGGQLPTLQWMLAAGVSVFLASWLVIRRRVRLRWMVPALTVAQLWLHVTTSVANTTTQLPGPLGHAHAHGDQAALTWPMLAAHLISAGVTALIWTFRRRLRRVLRIRPPQIPATRVENRVSTRSAVRFARDLLWVTGGPRRGPPMGLATVP